MACSSMKIEPYQLKSSSAVKGSSQLEGAGDVMLRQGPELCECEDEKRTSVEGGKPIHALRYGAQRRRRNRPEGEAGRREVRRETEQMTEMEKIEKPRAEAGCQK